MTWAGSRKGGKPERGRESFPKRPPTPFLRGLQTTPHVPAKVTTSAGGLSTHSPRLSSDDGSKTGLAIPEWHRFRLSRLEMGCAAPVCISHPPPWDTPSPEKMGCAAPCRH